MEKSVLMFTVLELQWGFIFFNIN